MKNSLYSDEYYRLTTWLRDQRIAQNLTMRELASKIGVHHSIIGKIEQQERRLDVVEYTELCKALNVSPLVGLKFMDKTMY